MILLDVDGVVAEFAGHVLGEAHFWGMRPDVVRQVGHDIVNWFPKEDEDEIKKIILSVNPLLIECLPYAAWGIAALQTLGPVKFVTIPMKGHNSWHWSRTSWLKEKFPGCGEPIFTADKHLILGDLFVDDRLDLCEAWSKQHNKRSLLMSQPYNEHEEPSSSLVHRVHSWPEIVEQARKVVQTIF